MRACISKTVCPNANLSCNSIFFPHKLRKDPYTKRPEERDDPSGPRGSSGGFSVEAVLVLGLEVPSQECSHPFRGGHRGGRKRLPLSYPDSTSKYKKGSRVQPFYATPISAPALGYRQGCVQFAAQNCQGQTPFRKPWGKNTPLGHRILPDVQNLFPSLLGKTKPGSQDPHFPTAP